MRTQDRIAGLHDGGQEGKFTSRSAQVESYNLQDAVHAIITAREV